MIHFKVLLRLGDILLTVECPLALSVGQMGGLGDSTGEQVHLDMDPSSAEETKQPLGDQIEHFM